MSTLYNLTAVNIHFLIENELLETSQQKLLINHVSQFHFKA